MPGESKTKTRRRKVRVVRPGGPVRAKERGLFFLASDWAPGGSEATQASPLMAEGGVRRVLAHNQQESKRTTASGGARC